MVIMGLNNFLILNGFYLVIGIKIVSFLCFSMPLNGHQGVKSSLNAEEMMNIDMPGRPPEPL